jgi:hypothetical protein
LDKSKQMRIPWSHSTCEEIIASEIRLNFFYHVNCVMH